MFDFGDPLKALSRLPVRRSTRYWLYSWPNGDRFSLAESSTHNTRGPIGATFLDAEKRTLEMISPSQPRSGGQWDSCKGSIEDDYLLRSGDRHLEGPLAEGAEIIVWDHLGARVVGREPQKPPPESTYDSEGLKAGMRQIDASIGNHPADPHMRDVMYQTERLGEKLGTYDQVAKSLRDIATRLERDPRG